MVGCNKEGNKKKPTNETVNGPTRRLGVGLPGGVYEPAGGLRVAAGECAPGGHGDAPRGEELRRVVGRDAAGRQDLHTGERAAQVADVRRPRIRAAGNSFTIGAPSCSASATSVGVRAPGMCSTPRRSASRHTAGSTFGATRNVAPAATDDSTPRGSSTVPVPSVRREP